MVPHYKRPITGVFLITSVTAIEGLTKIDTSGPEMVGVDSYSEGLTAVSAKEKERTRLNPVRHKSRGSKGKQKRW